MQLISILALAVVSLPCFATQDHFSLPGSADFYELEWPVRKVAIIGAGPSGLIAYREFIRAGFDVRIFERDDAPGGNWHYSEETPASAPVPNADPAIGDYVPSLPPDGVILPYEKEHYGRDCHQLRREHRGPKPLWDSLNANGPSPWQQFTELPWPVGTPWELSHRKLAAYLRAFASLHGINSNDDNRNASYNTRVELVQKRGDNGPGWALTLKKVERSSSRTCRATWWTENFDAVVVASGRYNAPNMPSIAGLADWQAKFPKHISHSREYRHPETYTNQTILIVGAGVSGSEISKDINAHARQVYQSFRPVNASAPRNQDESFLRGLPANTTVVPEIKRFLPISSGSAFSEGTIELINGTVITGIDHIVFATGFQYSYPFLRQHHNSTITLGDTTPEVTIQPIVTDGTHLRSLHLDLFYIDDPTIGFINMNQGISTFLFGEYLSLALAKVWDNKAKLPSKREMWRQHRERVVEQGGYNRHFQYVGFLLQEKIKFLVGWLNQAAVIYGGQQVDIPPKRNWEIGAIWAAIRMDATFGDSNGSSNTTGIRINEMWTNTQAGIDTEVLNKIYDVVFSDNW